MKVNVKLLSHVRLFATPRTVAYQAPLPMGFSRQKYWSELPYPSPEIIVGRFVNDGHSEWCEVILQCSFDLYFSNN